MRLSLVLAAVSVGALAPSGARAQAPVFYRVTFESTWSMATHPAGFPANAHFSLLAGISHGATVAFWAPGATASPGMEAMAERGQVVLLGQEFADAGSAAGIGFDGPDLPVSPGRVERIVLMTAAHPLLTLVTMLAPSPDWFVGVHGLDLRVNGAWPARAVVPLAVYDAGTDSGAAYTSPDVDTLPREQIALLGAPPFVAGAPVGTFTFERLATADGETAPRGAFALGAPAPNPVRAAAMLTLSVGESQHVRVRLVDALGRTVAVLAEASVAAGDLAVAVDASGLAAGVYTVVAEGERQRSVRRVVVR